MAVWSSGVYAHNPELQALLDIERAKRREGMIAHLAGWRMSKTMVDALKLSGQKVEVEEVSNGH